MPTTGDPVRRRAIWVRDAGICVLCGQPVAFEVMHLDHILPVSLGGVDTDDNLRPTHPRCNASRGNGRVARGRSAQGSLSLRLPSVLHTRLLALAGPEHRSLTAEVIHLLEEAVARAEQKVRAEQASRS